VFEACRVQAGGTALGLIGFAGKPLAGENPEAKAGPEELCNVKE
jgi:hypothetical protein